MIYFVNGRIRFAGDSRTMEQTAAEISKGRTSRRTAA